MTRNWTPEQFLELLITDHQLRNREGSASMLRVLRDKCHEDKEEMLSLFFERYLKAQTRKLGQYSQIQRVITIR